MFKKKSRNIKEIMKWNNKNAFKIAYPRDYLNIIDFFCFPFNCNGEWNSFFPFIFRGTVRLAGGIRLLESSGSVRLHLEALHST